MVVSSLGTGGSGSHVEFLRIVLVGNPGVFAYILLARFFESFRRLLLTYIRWEHPRFYVLV